MTLAIDPKSCAVVSCDLQHGILARYGDAASSLLSRVAGVQAAAREAGAFVAHVRVGFRRGHPEVSVGHAFFGAVKQKNGMLLDTNDTAIHDAVAPRGAEPTVVKHRVGPFLGTDLEQMLRASAAKTLVLLGVSTSGVILSAVRYASDADFQIVVASDGCADRDDEVHRVLVTKVFPRQATVASCAEICAALRASAAPPADA